MMGILKAFGVSALNSADSRISASAKPLKVVLVSDTHGLHGELDLPDGDILIHAGDVSFFGGTRSPFVMFDDWLATQPHRHKVIIPGNHDAYLEDPAKRNVIQHGHLLVASGIEIAGLRVWGSPMTPYGMVPFGLGKSEDRRKLWQQVPNDLDILITHIPPFGILDSSGDSDVGEGCSELAQALEVKKPRLVVFGHVHGASGSLVRNQIAYVNASLAGDGELVGRPFVARLEPGSRRPPEISYG